MQGEQHELEELHIKHLDLLSTCPYSKRTSRQIHHNRILMKMHLIKQTLQECLDTFDFFKHVMEDQTQKAKLIRDVMKNIELKVYDAEAIIYNKGDISESMYMVIKGAVSLCLPVIKEEDNAEGIDYTQREVQYDYQQIDSFEEGVGFGESQFIQSKKRSLVAKVKVDGTVIGCINALAFEQIIELYRQRVYIKKFHMFSKCPLFKTLKPHQLQFIINNAKPITFPISKVIVREGELPKSLYLITQGQVELRREEIVMKDDGQKLKKKFSKRNVQTQDTNRIKIKHVIVGILEEGGFLGDSEVAINEPYHFTAVCKSEKVKAYACNQKIIESQITEECFQSARDYYRDKIDYRLNKTQVYREAKDKIQKQFDNSQAVVLSHSKKKIKRQILNRYVQKTPTLIGQLSPHQISLSIDRKYTRIKTLSPMKEYSKEDYLAVLSSKAPAKKISRKDGALSPSLKKSQQVKRKYSQPSSEVKPKKQNSKQKIPFFYSEDDGKYLRSETRPLLVFMRPFHKKVQSLHERIAKQYQSLKAQKQREMDKIQKIRNEHDLSMGEIRRLSEFINKVQSQKQKLE